jgi:hypothetical protein
MIIVFKLYNMEPYEIKIDEDKPNTSESFGGAVLNTEQMVD